jgi:hypothetical protein
MIVWAMALGLAIAAQSAEPQESLADKAARARKSSSTRPKPAGKVLTNEDLANAKGNVIILSAPAGAAEPEAAPAPAAEAPAKPAAAEPTDDEKRTQAGAALQKQIDEQAEAIRRAQKAIADAEAELNDITNYTFGTRRAARMQSIDEARQAMAAAQRSIDELEEQARRQGIRVTTP